MGLTASTISFQVDTYTRSVFTTAQGVLRVDDFVEHARELAHAGVFAYPQLIDARQAQLKVSPSDIRKLVTLNRELRKIHGPAKTAFLSKRPADFGMMRMYEQMIGEDDPGFAVFYDIRHAEQWIAAP